MGGLGTTEIILIFLVVLLVFGAKRIPEIARGLGKGIREFKDATTDIKKELTVEEERNRIHNTRPPQQGATTPRTDAFSAPAPEPAVKPGSTE
ncbi:MAG: twin-arginine translocase TatA/TatE family subunit [Rhodothermales bacterium]